MIQIYNGAEGLDVFTQEQIDNLKKSWTNYLYGMNIFIHILPASINDETADKMIKAIEHIHPYNSNIEVYRV